MAGKPITGEGLSANLAGMSKNQLYDIMSQMKLLIEQNQQQARQILTQNPQLTRALFQAQIMLGMVQPPQVIPNIQPAMPPSLSQPVQQAPQPTNQAGSHSMQGRIALPGQGSAWQTHIPSRKQHQTQPARPNTSATGALVNLSSSSMSSHPPQTAQQPKAQQNILLPPMTLPQSSQVPSVPPGNRNSVAQPRPLQSQMQQPLQASGIQHMPSLQPLLPPQPRPPSMPNFHHQSQMGPNVGYQHSAAPQVHHSQPIFHSGIKPPASIGPPFTQGQPPHPDQQLPQSMYQPGGSHLGTEWANPAGNSMQVDRGSPWMPGPPENIAGTQLPGPPSLFPGQMGPGSHPPAPSSLTPEMENALLQQVMSLTPEQINLLPAEQRQQVLQLQQMLRK